MALVFNEAAFKFLIEAPDGPFGNRLRLVAETVTDNYNEAIGGVWENQPADIKAQAGYDIALGEFGLQATIGILDPGVVRRGGKKTISQVIADKFAEAEPDKFVPAIMAGWDNEL